MRLAFVNGRRCEAGPGLEGICQGCQSPMIPKCGTLRAWHWAHKSKRRCDPPDGEFHIADVKLPDSRVLEFQHSPISEVERRSREVFYRSMIWIVDGLRRKRDQKNFANTLHIANRKPLVYSGFENECALLRDWVGRPVDVLFDFGARDEDTAKFGRPVLWQLHPDPQRRVIYTDAFIEMLLKGGRLQRISYKVAPSPPPTAPQPDRKRRRIEGFLQYLQRMDRTRFRL